MFWRAGLGSTGPRRRATVVLERQRSSPFRARRMGSNVRAVDGFPIETLPPVESGGLYDEFGHAHELATPTGRINLPRLARRHK